jgi:membrane protein implicated in regulation of membrane protease activity
MQNVIVFIILTIAALYLVRRFLKSLKKTPQGQCGCGCSGCHTGHAKGVQIQDKSDTKIGDRF